MNISIQHNVAVQHAEQSDNTSIGQGMYGKLQAEHTTIYISISSGSTFVRCDDATLLVGAGTERRRLLLREQHEIVLQQLERATARKPESAGFLVVRDVLQTLSGGGRQNRGLDKLASPGRTTTKDFLTPNTQSLARYLQPSGYSAVTSLWKPGASTDMCRWFGRMLCRPKR